MTAHSHLGQIRPSTALPTVDAADANGREAVQARLVAAVEVLDVKAVRQALADGADATAPAHGEHVVQSLLHLAVRLTYHHVETDADLNSVMEALCDAGADLHAQDSMGQTLWHCWAQVPQALPELSKRLTAAQASVNVFDARGYSPIALALMNEHYDRARVLAQQGATPMGTDEHPHLTFAQVMGHFSGVSVDDSAELQTWLTWYLDQPPELLRRANREGRTLGQEVWQAHRSVLQRLHEAGVDWDAPVVQAGRVLIYDSHGAVDEDRNPWPVTVRAYLCQMAQHYCMDATVAFFDHLDAQADQKRLQAAVPTPSKQPPKRRPRM